MTEPQVGALIDQQDWRFAKTMPEWPHWYCLRKNAPNPQGFEALAQHIVEAGYRAEFRPERREAWAIRRYLDVGDFHYWIMDDTPAEATLINRARHPNVAVRL